MRSWASVPGIHPVASLRANISSHPRLPFLCGTSYFLVPAIRSCIACWRPVSLRASPSAIMLSVEIFIARAVFILMYGFATAVLHQPCCNKELLWKHGCRNSYNEVAKACRSYEPIFQALARGTLSPDRDIADMQ